MGALRRENEHGGAGTVQLSKLTSTRWLLGRQL
jgi:hypothetical protein